MSGDYSDKITVDEGRRCLHVDILKDNQVEEAFHLVKQLEKSGDNVGINEFPDLSYFKDILRYSNAFSLHELNELQGIILIVPKFDGHSRSVNPLVATVYIFTSLESSACKRDLVKIAQRLTVQVNRGYGACAVNVFYPCREWIYALRDEGFVSVVCVQRAGKLRTFPDNMPSYVMYKDLGVGPQPKLSLKEVQQFADYIIGTPEPYVPRTVPNLPLDHVLHDGTETVVRIIRADETRKLYELFCREGYGWDEFPTLNFFEQTLLSRGYSVVVEEKVPSDGTRTTPRWIGAMLVSDSGYSRCNRTENGEMSQLCDMYYAAGGSEFEGRGFAGEIGVLMGYVTISLGYSAFHGDVSMAKTATMINSLHFPGTVLTGVMPSAVYYEDMGWKDVAVFYTDMSHYVAAVDKYLQRHNKISVPPKLSRL